MPCRANQDGQLWWRVLTKYGPLEKGMANHSSILALKNPMNSMKRQKDRTLKDELPRSVGAQYVTGNQWRNNSRKNEGREPRQKQYPVVDVTGDRSKVQQCKEQYCIGTWNVRSMNEGKLEMVKHLHLPCESSPHRLLPDLLSHFCTGVLFHSYPCSLFSTWWSEGAC